jgi:lipopolysaccharide export system ATP-binding protein
VDGVSLDVTSGEVVGLLGPNGAGKTTCFYMIVGLVPADAGRIHLDARELTQLPIHRRARLGISYLPQENSVFRKLSVEENVQAVLELQGLPRTRSSCGSPSCSRNSTSRICASTRRCRSQAVSAGASRSRAR